MNELRASQATFDTPRLVASATIGFVGLLTAGLWVFLSIDIQLLAGLGLGFAGAVLVQWAQVMWFTANVKRTEHIEWIRRLPPSLASLRRPLRAMISEMDQRVAALTEAQGREQTRSIEAAALQAKVQSLETTLSETRSDMVDLLDGLDAISQTDGGAHLDRIRRVALLRSNLQGPLVVTPLGELVARLAGGQNLPADKVTLDGSMPTVACPLPLVETLIDEILAELAGLSTGRIAISGQSDGGMAVLTFRPAALSGVVAPDLSIAQRAARLLGGDTWVSADRSIVAALPRRYEPGLEAIRPREPEWDIAELF